jgi:hypothetical protein
MTRHRKTRRRGGGRNPGEWMTELRMSPTQETLNRVVLEIRAFSNDRGLIAGANQLLVMIRVPLGSRETREQRLAEIIRRLIAELRERAPGWRPGPELENARAVGRIKGLSKGGLGLPEDVGNQVVGFLSPPRRGPDGGPGPAAAGAGGPGPAAAGAGGPAGGRRRKTTRRRK